MSHTTLVHISSEIGLALGATEMGEHLLWSSFSATLSLVITLIIFYKRRPIRDGRQIVEKNKRQGLAFSKKLRDSAHWGPEAVEAEFRLEAI